MESFWRGLFYDQKPNSDLMTKKLNENSFGTIKTDQHQNCKKKCTNNAKNDKTHSTTFRQTATDSKFRNWCQTGKNCKLLNFS